MDLLAQTSPFDTVAGLPVHALVVHAVVVLLPLAAVGALVIAFVPKWSIRFGVLVWILALVGFGATLVAEQSGEQLAKRVGAPEQHVALGDELKLFAFALLVTVFVLWLIDVRATGKRTRLTKVLAGLVVLAALLAMWWTFRTGDSGARAVWGPVIANPIQQ